MTQPKSDIRNVSLRILRDGPTHNHLLSPLTAYLAAVGPYEAVSVRMPYEHRRLLRDLNALRYGATPTRAADTTRIAATDRRIIADDVGAIFAAVPGLTAEMATEASCDGFLTHLCLVFSAAELSLLPFEIATAPRGFPGEGAPISIQSVAPVVMTRAIPGATGRKCRWDREPNVLFIVAQPPGLPEVPVKAHLLALIKALRPWVGSTLESLGRGTASERILEKRLTVLPNATLSEIEEQCRQKAFTHVHILAHSQTFEEGSQTQFALALHGAGGGTELVSSERLQAALRLPMRRTAADDKFSHPLVVSLATCDSGNQAQVIFPTMSLAHALHAAGVPLVVGSLFPLSYRGSVVMTEALYSGLLRGRDPRRVLYDVRHDMFRADQQTHDWASLVAYASLPDDDELQAQIQGFAFSAASASIKAGVDGGKALVEDFKAETKAAADGQKPDATAFAKRVFANDEAIGMAANDLPLGGAYTLEGRGSLASSAKRRAEVLWYAARAVGVTSEPGQKLLDQSKETLALAREGYLKASRAPRWMQGRPQGELPTMHWVMTQALSLGLVLDRQLNALNWWVAVQDANNYLEPSVDRDAGSRLREQDDTLWAYASKAELFLLAYGAFESDQQGLRVSSDEAELRKEALSNTRLHVEWSHAIGHPELVVGTAKNFLRYQDWWFDKEFVAQKSANDPIGGRIQKLVTELLAILPAVKNVEPTTVARARAPGA